MIAMMIQTKEIIITVIFIFMICISNIIIFITVNSITSYDDSYKNYNLSVPKNHVSKYTSLPSFYIANEILTVPFSVTDWPDNESSDLLPDPPMDPVHHYNLII